MLSQAIMAKMIKRVIMAVMEGYNMATNVAVIGVCGRIRHENGIEKNRNCEKIIAISKFTLKLWPISFVF